MSNQITTAFVQQYSTNIAMLLQQQGSRLRNAVQVQSFTGKAASVVEQFGQVAPVKNSGRHSDTPLIPTPQDRRWVYPVDYDWADLIDDQDKLRLLIDPTGPYTQAGVLAMGRAMDDEIINGMFGSNNTGENGSSATGTLGAYNSGSQVVLANVGASANTGLNIAKLRAAKKKLMAAEVDVDNDMLFIALSAEQHDNLLNEAQAISLDYNTKPVLVDGRITAFMGFNFIQSERIPGAPSYNGSLSTGGQYYVPFWAKTGVALGMWNDVSASVDKRPDKRNSTQVYVTGTFGGTRLEEKRVGYIQCV
jgi:hypothetical protein